MKETIIITGENMHVEYTNNNKEQSVRQSISFVGSVGSNSNRPQTKAEKRIAALMARGVDTSMYFPMGNDHVIKIENGSAVDVEMDDVEMDDVERKMIEGGYINNYTLFRRWVMAQMFRLLRWEEECGAKAEDRVANKPYSYAWKILEQELHAQCKMEEHGDTENYEMRHRWFDADVVRNMLAGYRSMLWKELDSKMYRVNPDGLRVPRHTCKGKPYVRIDGEDVFFSDISTKVFGPIRNIEFRMSKCVSMRDWYELVRDFNRIRKNINKCLFYELTFLNAYLGSGAYFTMRNLIMFHGAKFRMNDAEIDKTSSLRMIDDACKEKDGYKMMNMLRQLIKDSGISVDGKISEWKK